MKNRILKLCLALFVISVVLSCGSDDDTTPTPTACDSHDASYDGDVKEIINTTCAYAGCHDGTNTSIPELSRDYTSFAGMQSAINTGAFNTRVLVDQDMPPTFAPEPNPKVLTTIQLEIITCWKDAGFPEN